MYPIQKNTTKVRFTRRFSRTGGYKRLERPRSPASAGSAAPPLTREGS